MDIKFRDLRADEIDVRIQSVTDRGVILLLYKDARVDQNILDETVGNTNWQRDHKELKNNIYCGISIWDKETQHWVTKWDCGKETFSDSEKGESSDSFKRAGFNWGIGRELYTAPFLWIPSNKCNITEEKGKKVCKDKFVVESITIENKQIKNLVIKNTTLKIIVYPNDNSITNSKENKPNINVDEKLDEIFSNVEINTNQNVDATQSKQAYVYLSKAGINVVDYLKSTYGINNTNKLTIAQFEEIKERFSNQ